MSDTKSLRWAAKNPPKDCKDLSFAGKTVLVTGANSGLGHHAAIKYAAQGASTLILLVRTQAKGDAASAAIIKATGCSPEIFAIETVDFSKFSSVAECCERINAKYEAVHVAQLAAGICTHKFHRSPDGYEIAMQVDVLSQALLALLLLPKMRATAKASPSDDPPRFSFVNSIASMEVKADWFKPAESLVGWMDDEARFDFQKQYWLVKLASLFVMQGLIDRLHELDTADGVRQSPSVVINANCPGLCKTNLGREFPIGQQIMMMGSLFFLGRTAEQGGRTLVSATALGRDSHGRMWKNDALVPQSDFLKSQRGQELYTQTWGEILAILRKNVKSSAL